MINVNDPFTGVFIGLSLVIAFLVLLQFLEKLLGRKKKNTKKYI